MKKIYVLLFAIIFTLSCNKETIEADLQQNEQKKFLTFKTVSEYESAITSLSTKTNEQLKEWATINNPNAIILHKTSSEIEQIGIFDMVLATLLNNDGIIAIEKNAYKVDILNESVKRIELNTFQNVTDFENKAFTTNYTLDEDILYPEIENSKWCYGSCGYNQYTPSNWYLYDEISERNLELDRKIVYQRAGVYYSLQAKIKRTNLSSGGNVNYGFQVVYYPAYWSYVNYYMRNKYDCHPDQKIPGNVQGGNIREYNYRPYSSTRHLRGFNFTVAFYAHDYGNGHSYTDTHSIICQ